VGLEFGAERHVVTNILIRKRQLGLSLKHGLLTMRDIFFAARDSGFLD